MEAVYEIISATGAQTAGDLLSGWLHNTHLMLRRLRGDRETRRLLGHALGIFWRAVAEVMGLPLPEHPDDDPDSDEP